MSIGATFVYFFWFFSFDISWSDDVGNTSFWAMLKAMSSEIARLRHRKIVINGIGDEVRTAIVPPAGIGKRSYNKINPMYRERLSMEMEMICQIVQKRIDRISFRVTKRITEVNEVIDAVQKSDTLPFMFKIPWLKVKIGKKNIIDACNAPIIMHEMNDPEVNNKFSFPNSYACDTKSLLANALILSGIFFKSLSNTAFIISGKAVKTILYSVIYQSS